MKKITVFISLILAIILALSSSACGGAKILSLTAFNTGVRIESHDKNISKTTENKIKELLLSLEQEFDKDQPDSFTYLFNSSGLNEKLSLSQPAKEILALAKDAYAFSNGKFNPAIAPLVKLWQFDDFNKVVQFIPPEPRQVQAALKNTDFDKVVLEQDVVYRTSLDINIDLGGIVKGYAVDKILQILLTDGHQTGYINVGNSSMALLSVQSLNVAHPRASEEKPIILTVNCSDKLNATLSTSGDYQRFHEYAGERYSHIIDSQTGYPIQTGITSATIIGGTGAFSDAMTTALCATSHCPNDLENSDLILSIKKILTQLPDCDIYVVYDKDGIKQIVTNKKQGEDFTLLDSEYAIINVNL